MLSSITKNARLHAAPITRPKVMICLRGLHHRSHSPDLVPTDYPLFRVLNNSFIGKVFENFYDAKSAIQELSPPNLTTLLTWDSSLA